MKFLLDTNVLIAAEPTRPEHLEAGAAVASALLGAIAAGSHQPLVHAASLEELRGDPDPARRAMREVLLLKYPRLPNPPSVSRDLEKLIGVAAPGSHDAIDHALLEAIRANAVDYLVTEDQRLLRKAAIAGLGDRVVTPADALATLRALFPITPAAPPAVRSIFAHELRESDTVFSSLRKDYPGFDSWIVRCKRQQRRGWLIESSDGNYAGVCLVKDNEDPGVYGLRGRLVKLSTFKVSERHRGFRYGELLLKAALSYADLNRYDTVFVTVFPRYSETIALLEEFGFRKQEARTNLGELVLAKALTFSSRDYAELNPIEFHIRFGPSNLKVRGTTAFIVPIQPRYHDLLFPEAQRQQSLLPGRYSFGNSIRKAYICRAQIRDLPAGSPLLFYRSQDQRAVNSIGVAESCLRSSNATEIARFVGKRTVYSLAEIETLCRKEILAVLFRHSQVLDPPISLAELKREGLLKAAPQSIVTVPSEAMAWLRSRLER